MSAANCDGLLPTAECVVAKVFDDIAMFLAKYLPSSPPCVKPKNLTDLLRSSSRCLPSSLRCALAEVLIILNKTKFEEIGDTLGLFMELQSLGDKSLRKLAFDHVVHSISRMNQKKQQHNYEAKNQTLQNILFEMLLQEEEDESKAKRSLIVLCDLYRQRVWCDDRTANAICTACFHSSSRIMIAALSFILGYDMWEEVEDTDASGSEDEMKLLDYDMLEEALDSDASSNEDEMKPPKVVLNKEDVHKAVHKGTIATSKKKKKAKLHCAFGSIERQQRSTSEETTPNHYSPLHHLKDAQGFVEKLFSRLEACNERFEVKMMKLKVIARTIGLHRLILLNFYRFLQKYVQPHQCNIIEILAAVVQACHDMVPLVVVKPLFTQVVNQFVHDHCSTEAVVVGLNTVRDLCLRIPRLMTKRLFQDLILYQKSHEKAISKGARSLISLFLEDCGCSINFNAQPAFGEVNVSSSTDLKVLKHEDEDDDGRDEDVDDKTKLIKVKSKKRKFVYYTGQLNASDITLRAPKRSTESKMEYALSDFTDGILSNEDFERTKELRAIICTEMPKLCNSAASNALWVGRMQYLSTVCEKRKRWNGCAPVHKIAHATLKGPSVVKEICNIGTVLGLIAGGMWKMHRKVRAFYDMPEKGSSTFSATFFYLHKDDWRK